MGFVEVREDLFPHKQFFRLALEMFGASHTWPTLTAEVQPLTWSFCRRFLFICVELTQFKVTPGFFVFNTRFYWPVSYCRVGLTSYLMLMHQHDGKVMEVFCDPTKCNEKITVKWRLLICSLRVVITHNWCWTVVMWVRLLPAFRWVGEELSTQRLIRCVDGLLAM